MPEGKDPTSTSEITALKSLKPYRQAISLLDYKIMVRRNMHNLDTIEDKLKLLNGMQISCRSMTTPLSVNSTRRTTLRNMEYPMNPCRKK